MYKIKTISQLGQRIFYQHLTFPKYQASLLEGQNSSTVAVGAFDTEPIGLALAKIHHGNRLAAIQSIFVDQNYRSQGVGTALLKNIEQQLSDRGCQEIQISYTTQSPTTHGLEMLLLKQNWSSPEKKQVICKCDRRVLSAQWLKREYALSKNYQIKHWHEITEIQRNNLKAQNIETPWIPRLLNPFIHEIEYESLNSLGLLYKEELVGWILTHRLTSDTIRYTSGYIRPDLQRMARLIPLVSEAVRLQAKVQPDSKGIWSTPYIFPHMVAFITKYLAPYAIYLKESKSSRKEI